VKQARLRIFAGDTKSPGKIVRVFEPHMEIVRKGKASKPTDFGKLVEIQEAENQIETTLKCSPKIPNQSIKLGTPT
jgi:transposase, IS5 family